MAETATRDEIRQAVAYGQQLAVRRLLDALRKQRPQRDGWRLVYEADDTMPSAMAWVPDMHALQQSGYDAAARVVKGYRVDPTEEPT